VQAAEKIQREEGERARRSAELAEECIGRFCGADEADGLQRACRELTPAVKARLTPGDLVRVRRAFTVRLAQLQSVNGAPAKAG